MPSRKSLARPAAAARENAGAVAKFPPMSAEQSLGYQIRYAYRIFVKALADELGPHRITTGQWSALRALWQEEGLSQVELAQRMMVEKASLTAVLKAMASAGLITRIRNTEDRRKVNIYLTAAGRRLKSKILPLIGKINKRATRRLSSADVHQLHMLLAQVMINLQN
jgi:MarR family transcriptional regulator, organic hydroperoxide resistance regulator